MKKLLLKLILAVESLWPNLIKGFIQIKRSFETKENFVVKGLVYGFCYNFNKNYLILDYKRLLWINFWHNSVEIFYRYFTNILINILLYNNLIISMHLY